MNEVEMIDVVDENGKVVDTMSREETERLNHLIQNVLIFIFNSRGEVWIQKRPMNKKHFPGLWDISACGAVGSGEAADVAAQRETLEETGLKTNLSYVESFLNIFPGHGNQTFSRLSHLYIATSDDVPQANEEVDEFRPVPYKQLRIEAARTPEQYVPSFLLELEKAINALRER